MGITLLARLAHSVNRTAVSAKDTRFSAESLEFSEFLSGETELLIGSCVYQPERTTNKQIFNTGAFTRLWHRPAERDCFENFIHISLQKRGEPTYKVQREG